jgi:hypothetical protein
VLIFSYSRKIPSDLSCVFIFSYHPNNEYFENYFQSLNQNHKTSNYFVKIYFELQTFPFKKWTVLEFFVGVLLSLYWIFVKKFIF